MRRQQRVKIVLVFMENRYGNYGIINCFWKSVDLWRRPCKLSPIIDAFDQSTTVLDRNSFMNSYLKCFEIPLPNSNVGWFTSSLMHRIVG